MTAIVPVPSAALAVIAPLVERARGYADDARAPNTARAYAADFAAFEAWALEHDLPSLPAPPVVVATYLAALADAGRKVATIERALAGIAYAHRAGGHGWQKGASEIASVLAGIRRRLGTSPMKKAPVIDRDLVAMLGTLKGDLAGIRNRALLTVGFFAALRRSELASLEVADLEFRNEGLLVTVRRSKTDQTGEGMLKGLPYAGSVIACPVRSTRAWLDAAGITEGAVFRGVDRRCRVAGESLCDRSVARIVKQCAEAAGLDPKRFSGHSLRAGFATTAASRGKSLEAIMRQTGHKSERVARGYIRHATAFVDNAAAGLL